MLCIAETMVCQGIAGCLAACLPVTVTVLSLLEQGAGHAGAPHLGGAGTCLNGPLAGIWANTVCVGHQSMALALAPVQGEVLGAVLPLFEHRQLGAAGARLIASLVCILASCSWGVLAPVGAPRLQRILRASAAPPGAPARAAVDAVQVQQIIEMGFPQPAAELALRRVRLPC